MYKPNVSEGSPGGHPPSICFDGPIPREPAQKPKQHSTLLKVTDAYCQLDALNMKLLSARKLTAQAVEKDKLAKRVNLVHRMSESNVNFDTDGSDDGLPRNITDRTMELVKLLSTLDQFKARNGLNAQDLKSIKSVQGSAINAGNQAPSARVAEVEEESSEESPLEEQEWSNSLEALQQESSGVGNCCIKELLQRPWQLRMLQQLEQQQQQAHQAEAESEDEVEGQQQQRTQPTTPRKLPFTQQLPSSKIEALLRPPSQLPTNVHSLRLLSSPDARHTLVSMAVAREYPEGLVLETWHRAKQKQPHTPHPFHFHHHQQQQGGQCTAELQLQPQLHASPEGGDELSQARQGQTTRPLSAAPSPFLAVACVQGNPDSPCGAQDKPQPPAAAATAASTATAAPAPAPAATPSPANLKPSAHTQKHKNAGATDHNTSADEGTAGAATGAAAAAAAAAAAPGTSSDMALATNAAACNGSASQAFKSHAMTPNPANAAKRTIPTDPPERLANGRGDGRNKKRSKSPGKKGHRKRSKSLDKKSEQPDKGRPKSPSTKDRSKSPTTKKKGAGSSSQPPPSPSQVSSPAAQLKAASTVSRTGTESGSRRSKSSLKGSSGKVRGPELTGCLKPMLGDAIGPNGRLVEDPEDLKEEADKRKAASMHAFALQNPAGFNEDEAASEVAAFSEATDRSRHILAIAQDLPADQVGAKSLRSAMQELSYRRPFLVVPKPHKLSSTTGAAAAIQAACQQQAHARTSIDMSKGTSTKGTLGMTSKRSLSLHFSAELPHYTDVSEDSRRSNARGEPPYCKDARQPDHLQPGNSGQVELGGSGMSDGMGTSRPSTSASRPGTSAGKDVHGGSSVVPRKQATTAQSTSRPGTSPGKVTLSAGGVSSRPGASADGTVPSRPGTSGRTVQSGSADVKQRQRQQQQGSAFSGASAVSNQQQSNGSNGTNGSKQQQRPKSSMPGAVGTRMADNVHQPDARVNLDGQVQDTTCLEAGSVSPEAQTEQLTEEPKASPSGNKEQGSRRMGSQKRQQPWRQSSVGSKQLTQRFSFALPKEEEEEPPGWTASQHSLFVERALIGFDSRDMLDTPVARHKQLDLDWRRLVSRHPFRCFMAFDAHPPPIVELPPPPKEEPEEQGFTFQRLMALHAASSSSPANTSKTKNTQANPEEQGQRQTTMNTSAHPQSPGAQSKDTHTSTSTQRRVRQNRRNKRSSPPSPSTQPSQAHARADQHPSTLQSYAQQPNTASSSRGGSRGSQLAPTPSSPVPVSKPSTARQQQRPQASTAGSQKTSMRSVSSGPKRQGSTPRLPKAPTTTERVQLAIQRKPALEWHSESWLQMQECMPQWIPGHSSPQMHANIRQQKRTPESPPSHLIPLELDPKSDESGLALNSQAQALEEALSEIQGVLLRHHPLLLSTFASYALVVQGGQGPEAGLMLPLTAWSALMEDCRLIDSARPDSQHKQYVAAFTAACSGKRPLPPHSPPTDMLLRFEFFEALIRVAVLKYIKPGQLRKVHEAVEALISDHLEAHLPPDVQQDPNTFRATVLSTYGIDLELQRAAPMLRALHALACAERQTKYLKLEGWVEVLQSLGIIGLHVGVSIPAAATIFTQSQLLVVDEIKFYWRVCGLDCLDFLEALCRVAALLDPPFCPELQRRLHECLGVTPEHLLSTMADHPYYTYYSRLARQPDAIKPAEPEVSEGSADTTGTQQPQQQSQQQQQPKSGSELKKQQQQHQQLVPPPDQSQQQQAPEQQHTPLQILRHKLCALLDFIWGSLHAEWGTQGDRSRLLERMNNRVEEVRAKWARLAQASQPSIERKTRKSLHGPDFGNSCVNTMETSIARQLPS